MSKVQSNHLDICFIKHSLLIQIIQSKISLMMSKIIILIKCIFDLTNDIYCLFHILILI